MSSSELILAPNSLAVFLDETGHEDLRKGHYVYALGGCAIQVGSLDLLIRAPWKNIRKTITGDPNKPLHASEITPKLSLAQQASIGDFFSSPTFMRVAAAITTTTRIPAAFERIQILAPTLFNRIADVFKWTSAESISLIFESNPRMNSKIEHYFSQINLMEGDRRIPIAGYFMPKSAGEPALEVADFIMHAVNGLARWQVDGRNGYERRDFKAVFQSVGKKLASFMLLSEATYTSQKPNVQHQ